ncbi:hypothetical protein FOZ61_002222 [Perkinsus olseni]|nr:hypothetical protein FOZ61_002222 [Perkinsus olseni]
MQLSFQGKDTYQLRALLSEGAGENWWRADTELGSEGSPIMLYTNLVETLTSLGENVDHFHPERGMLFCFDHGNGVAAYFGAENPNDREALKVRKVAIRTAPIISTPPKSPFVINAKVQVETH